MIQLYIANKNYSSWSMRPWVLLRQAGIDFEEVFVRFDSFAPDSQFKTTLKDVNPVGKVPVLVHDGLAVWDTLAIAEYVAETWPDKQLWPADAKARARARSVCAERPPIPAQFSGAISKKPISGGTACCNAGINSRRKPRPAGLKVVCTMFIALYRCGVSERQAHRGVHSIR